MERTAQRARNSLFPTRESVTEDYWEYAKFRFLQRMASSCITVFATQQMLAAIGMGASRRLPAAAAINWVLKDGLGRLGKLGVAANFGREFDSDVKRFRFTSSVVYDASSLIEMITPFFPKKFLLLATVANIGKSVGITTANVVRAPIQRSFVLEENLAEVAAKTSAQQVVADNLGLAVAVLATGKFILTIVWAISMTSCFVNRTHRQSCQRKRSIDHTVRRVHPTRDDGFVLHIPRAQGCAAHDDQ